MVIAVLCAAAAALLIVAGLAKLRTPEPAAAMIAQFWPRARSARRIAQVSGVLELAAGLSTLGSGARPALAFLAACYLALTAVAVRLATSARPTACGCFGAADGVVGRAHVTLDLAALAAAVAGCVRPPGAAWTLFDHGALTGITVSMQALLLAALGYLSITALPAMAAARRQAEGLS